MSIIFSYWQAFGTGNSIESALLPKSWTIYTSADPMPHTSAILASYNI